MRDPMNPPPPVTSTFVDFIPANLTLTALPHSPQGHAGISSAPVTQAPENAADLSWKVVLERIREERPVVWCEWPELSTGAATPVHGELRLEGWAVAPAGIASLEVEIADRGRF